MIRSASRGPFNAALTGGVLKGCIERRCIEVAEDQLGVVATMQQ